MGFNEAAKYVLKNSVLSQLTAVCCTSTKLNTAAIIYTAKMCFRFSFPILGMGLRNLER